MNFIQNIFQNNRNRQSRPRPSSGGSTTTNNRPGNGGNNSTTNNTRPNANNSNTFGARAPPPQPQPPHEQARPMNPFEILTHQLHAAAQSAFHAQQEQQQHQQQSRPRSPTRAAPPASTKAIRQLPTVSVNPEDLVDENNRECCICFEENQLHDKVMRLPCAHIYHPRCIIEWLNRHCTCPVCRYELPTDNVVYERERKQRMKFRKPRYARYELERMQTKELKTLCMKLNVSTLGMMEKKEFVEALILSEKIILISAPEPVEYPSLTALRSMGVGQLKRAMKEAGVFFDSKDVVEKEDMVQIFVNSGRIVLTEKEDDSSNHATGISGNQCVDPYGNICPDYNEKYVEEAKRARLDDDCVTTYSNSCHSSSSSCAPATSVDMDVTSEEPPTSQLASDDHVSNNLDHHDEVLMEDRSNAVEEDNRETTTASSHSFQNENNDDTNDEHSGMNVENLSETTSNHQDPLPTTDIHSDEQPSFASRSIGEIRQLASSLKVDVSSCIEKREMVELIMDAIAKGARRPSSN